MSEKEMNNDLDSNQESFQESMANDGYNISAGDEALKSYLEALEELNETLENVEDKEKRDSGPYQDEEAFDFWGKDWELESLDSIDRTKIRDYIFSKLKEKNVYVVDASNEDIIKFRDSVLEYNALDNISDESYMELLQDIQEQELLTNDDSLKLKISDVKESISKGIPTIIVSEANIESLIFSGILENKLRRYEGDTLRELNKLSDASSSRIFDIKNLIID